MESGKSSIRKAAEAAADKAIFELRLKAKIKARTCPPNALGIDPNQFAKTIIDIAAGECDDAPPNNTR
jgi:hypothetical protein